MWEIVSNFMAFLENLNFTLPTHLPILWQYGLSSFQAGDIKLERFLLKNQHIYRKGLNFENWCSGKLTKIGHRFRKQSDLKIRIQVNHCSVTSD